MSSEPTTPYPIDKSKKTLTEKKLFTASDARKLAGPTVMERTEMLLDRIKELAKEKKRECKTGYDYTYDVDLWIQGGYSKTEDWKQAKKILEELGFKVSFYYSEGSIAVDMYTSIEW